MKKANDKGLLKTIARHHRSICQWGFFRLEIGWILGAFVQKFFVVLSALLRKWTKTLVCIIQLCSSSRISAGMKSSEDLQKRGKERSSLFVLSQIPIQSFQMGWEKMATELYNKTS